MKAFIYFGLQAILLLVVYLVSHFLKSSKRNKIFLGFLSFFCFNFFYNLYIDEKIQNWEYRRFVDSDQLFQLIKKLEPEAYEEIREIHKYDSKAYAKDRIAELLQEIKIKHLATASDNSVLNSVEEELSVLKLYKNKNNFTACYQYAVNGTVSLAYEKDLSTINYGKNFYDILYSALHNPQPIPTTKELEEILQKPYSEIFVKKLAAYSKQLKTGNKKAICESTIDIDESILKYPKKEAGLLYRAMLSYSQPNIHEHKDHTSANEHKKN